MPGKIGNVHDFHIGPVEFWVYTHSVWAPTLHIRRGWGVLDLGFIRFGFEVVR